MKIQKPTREELKKVQISEEDEDLTDREIWIWREYF